MFAPLTTLQTATALAVRMQRAMNATLDRCDYARYQREAARLDLAMNDPAFNWGEFKRLCRVYRVDF